MDNSTQQTNSTGGEAQVADEQLHTVDWSATTILLFLSVMAVSSLFGNGLTLFVIRTTPSLQTKTNRILASFAVSEMLFIVYVAQYIAYFFEVYVYRNPCDYAALDTVLVGLQKFLPKVSFNHVIVVCVDRYVAIAHPLIYEQRMTDTVVSYMIFGAWLSGAAMGFSFSLWAFTADSVPCLYAPSVVPAWYAYVLDVCHYFATAAFLVFVYARILGIAWKQHTAVRSENRTGIQSMARGQAGVPQGVDDERGQSAKYQKRQFKAVYMTAAVLICDVVMWLPYALGRTLQLASAPATTHWVDVAGSIGICNSCFNWILYAAVSKSFQQAYKKCVAGCFRTNQVADQH